MIKALFASLKKILPTKPAAPQQSPATKAAPVSKKIPAEKQAKLDALCAQLLNRKELIVSGKLQFMGLSKVKKRLGKQWDGLSSIVYGTVEDVFAQHLGKGDIFIRYHDEAYVLLFAYDDKDAATKKATTIAEEIRKRLFKLDEKQLREIEVRKAIGELRTSELKNGTFVDFLDAFVENSENFPADETGAGQQTTAHNSMEEMRAFEVDTSYHREKKQRAAVTIPENMTYSYLPLWDVRRSALTTYLCLAHMEKEDALQSYKKIFAEHGSDTLSLDLAILKKVMAELANISADGRKLLIACPVNCNTLQPFESYETYKDILQQIPQEHRQFLIFIVTGASDAAHQKDPYWFAPSLAGFCRQVFVEVPMRRDINFNYLKTSNIDVVGLQIDNTSLPEQDIMQIMNIFSIKAKAFKIPQTFILGISSLSLTTSAVCAGFSYLGGSAIHDYVTKPDNIHKFKHEDLLSHLMLDS